MEWKHFAHLAAQATPAQLSLLVVGTVVLGLAVALLPSLYKAFSTRRSPEHDEENVFQTESGSWRHFPSLAEPATCTLSVVVPAYNEEKRIGRMLDEMLGALAALARLDRTFTYEVIVVDDGSRKDDTAGYVQRNYVAKHGSGGTVRLCKLVRNVGKGGAVRKGALRAGGAYILMADADGATDAGEVGPLLAHLRAVEVGGLGVAVGSRAHLEAEEGGEAEGASPGAPKARRTLFRRFLMGGFKALLALLVGGLGVKDTQCGFKMFTRAAARSLFPAQHIERWAFDIELLYLASAAGMPVVEVAVQWEEVDGSKVDVLGDSLQMARDVAAIRLAYLLGIWRSDDAALPGWTAADALPPSLQSGGWGAPPSTSSGAPRTRK